MRECFVPLYAVICIQRGQHLESVLLLLLLLLPILVHALMSGVFHCLKVCLLERKLDDVEYDSMSFCAAQDTFVKSSRQADEPLRALPAMRSIYVVVLVTDSTVEFPRSWSRYHVYNIKVGSTSSDLISLRMSQCGFYNGVSCAKQGWSERSRRQLIVRMPTQTWTHGSVERLWMSARPFTLESDHFHLAIYATPCACSGPKGFTFDLPTTHSFMTAKPSLTWKYYSKFTMCLWWSEVCMFALLHGKGQGIADRAWLYEWTRL